MYAHVPVRIYIHTCVCVCVCVQVCVHIHVCVKCVCVCMYAYVLVSDTVIIWMHSFTCCTYVLLILTWRWMLWMKCALFLKQRLLSPALFLSTCSGVWWFHCQPGEPQSMAVLATVSQHLPLLHSSECLCMHMHTVHTYVHTYLSVYVSTLHQYTPHQYTHYACLWKRVLGC